jgi:hypothetical protein
MILTGDIGIFEIEILFSNNSSSNDFWESNWLHSIIKGNFPGFDFKFNTNIRTDDFKRALEKLQNLIANKNEDADFLTLEDNINLHFKREPTGSIKIKGKVVAIELSGCSLEFNFITDIATIEKFVSEISNLLNKYPIVGQP